MSSPVTGNIKFTYPYNGQLGYNTSTTSLPSTSAKITANGQMELLGKDADIVINGQSLVETLQAIQDHMAILVPNPKKLEKFESLKKAYEHYKMLEALCIDDTELD